MPRISGGIRMSEGKVKSITFLSLDEVRKRKEEEAKRTKEQKREHNERVKKIFRIPVKEG
jgi:hypothetical protein